MASGREDPEGGRTEEHQADDGERRVVGRVQQAIDGEMKIKNTSVSTMYDGYAGGAAHDSRVVIDDWAKLDEFVAKLPDPAADPRWDWVTVAPVEALRFVPLDELRSMPELAECRLLARGSRLSVMPLTDDEFDAIVNAGSHRAPNG